MKWDNQANQGLQGGVEGQLGQVHLHGEDQLDVDGVVGPKEDLTGGIILPILLARSFCLLNGTLFCLSPFLG